MKLLPTGRKSAFYLALYGSLVSLFVFMGVLLGGAGLGYWGVRKFVLSSDGNVDIGVAQFVKWATQVIGVLFVFESSYDTNLAIAAVVSSLSLCLIISSKARQRSQTRLSNRSLASRRKKYVSISESSRIPEQAVKAGLGLGRM